MKAILVGICVGLLPSLAAAEDAPTISAAIQDTHGILVHEVRAPHQKGVTQIKVLLPDKRPEGKRLSVVYVLPVEAGTEHRYGDGLLEVKKLNLHNQHGVIVVAPTFSQLPWYADHPTDAALRQESYFVDVVVPWVEQTYPAEPSAASRLLLGFSKSGWGAWSLLLRHPGTFGSAAAWDAPLMMDQPGKYGTRDIFGNQETFDKHRITDLLKKRAQELSTSLRLILTGYGNFRNEHEQVHALLEKLRIPHAYRDGPQRKHDWHSGWVEEAFELLVTASENTP